MKRRSFLGAMLASFTAPYVMADAVKRGSIMLPQPKKIILPGEQEIITSPFTGPKIELFTAAGILLASIPLTQQQQAMFDYGRRVGIDLSGTGHVIQSGVATRYSLELGEDRRINGDVNTGGFTIDNSALVIGQNITIPALQLNIDTPRAGRVTYSEAVKHRVLEAVARGGDALDPLRGEMFWDDEFEEWR